MSVCLLLSAFWSLKLKIHTASNSEMKLKIHTASNSEMKGRTDFFSSTECLVYKNKAVYINDYVRMSVIISFLATFFQV